MHQNQMKLIRSLAHKKYREKHGLFLVEGFRSVHEAVIANAFIESIFWTNEFSQKNPGFTNSIRNIQNVSISPSEMQQLSPSATPPGLLAICKIPPFNPPVMNNNFIYLDHVSDPGNMGTIL